MFILAINILFANDNFKKVEIKTSAVCEMCKDRIEKSLKEIDGVVSADLNLTNKVVTVEFDLTKTDSDKIKEKISETGYDADDYKKSKKAFKKLPKCCKSDTNH